MFRACMPARIRINRWWAYHTPAFFWAKCTALYGMATPRKTMIPTMVPAFHLFFAKSEWNMKAAASRGRGWERAVV